MSTMENSLATLYFGILAASILAFIVGFIGLFVSKNRARTVRILLYATISITICLLIGVYSIYTACGGKF